MIVQTILMVLALNPIDGNPSIRIIDPYKSIDTCKEVISVIQKQEEKQDPSESKIGNRLKCVYAYFDIKETKPPEPGSLDKEGYAHPCRSREVLGSEVSCKEANYVLRN